PGAPAIRGISLRQRAISSTPMRASRARTTCRRTSRLFRSPTISRCRAGPIGYKPVIVFDAGRLVRIKKEKRPRQRWLEAVSALALLFSSGVSHAEVTMLDTVAVVYSGVDERPGDVADVVAGIGARSDAAIYRVA